MAEDIRRAQSRNDGGHADLGHDRLVRADVGPAGAECRVLALRVRRRGPARHLRRTRLSQAWHRVTPAAWHRRARWRRHRLQLAAALRGLSASRRSRSQRRSTTPSPSCCWASARLFLGEKITLDEAGLAWRSPSRGMVADRPGEARAAALAGERRAMGVALGARRRLLLCAGRLRRQMAEGACRRIWLPSSMC